MKKTRSSKQREFCNCLDKSLIRQDFQSGPIGQSGLGGPVGVGGPVGPGGPGGLGGQDGQGGVSGHLTYRHLTYTGVCRSYVRFVQKKQTYDLQTPVILVMNSVGVMSICEVLSRLKPLKKPAP